MEIKEIKLSEKDFDKLFLQCAKEIDSNYVLITGEDLTIKSAPNFVFDIDIKYNMYVDTETEEETNCTASRLSLSQDYLNVSAFYNGDDIVNNCDIEDCKIEETINHYIN